MEIGALRDIVIINLGIVVMITAILAAVLMSSVYRKVSPGIGEGITPTTTTKS